MFKLKYNKMEVVVKLYEWFMKSLFFVVRFEVLYGFVLSYVYINFDKVVEYEKKLLVLWGLIGLDVEVLEKVFFWFFNVKRGCVVEEIGEKVGENRIENVKIKKKCKWKFLYLKGFDFVNLGFLFDFERWLLRKEWFLYWLKKGKRN